jgi:hypothetical protein
MVRKHADWWAAMDCLGGLNDEIQLIQQALVD